MKKPLIFCLILLSSVWVNAQRDSTRYANIDDKYLEKDSFWEKCYTGGDFMFYIGSGQLNFNISPLLGYRPQNKGFSYGLGATYQFTRFDYTNVVYSYSLFGIRGFVRQNLGSHFFLHGELENYFTKGQNIFTKKVEPISIPCANAFIGYKQGISDFSYYYIMIGYEFIGDQNAAQYVYYTHPLLFKIGYIFDIKGK